VHVRGSAAAAAVAAWLHALLLLPHRKAQIQLELSTSYRMTLSLVLRRCSHVEMATVPA
jgi:hypothetical protein